jgi:malonate transporter and related proteins
MRSKRAASIALAVIKLVIMPLAMYGLCLALGLNPLYIIVAVVCAAVPTAKTVFILAGEYRVGGGAGHGHGLDHNALSVVTLLGWLYALSVPSPQAA